MIYLQEHGYDGYDVFDPITYQEAIHCPQFTSWKEAMDDEVNSMYMNSVWDLVELSHGCKPVGCKWVFKTKRDSSGKIGRNVCAFGRASSFLLLESTACTHTLFGPLDLMGQSSELE